MDNFLMAIMFSTGLLCGLSAGVLLCVHYHNKLIKVRLDAFIVNLDVLFGDMVLAIDETIKKNLAPRRMTTKPPSTPNTDAPPPHVLKMLEKMASISAEIQELVMTLDGPLKGSLDAKYRQANARQCKVLQTEMKEIITEILRLGFDPKIMFMDAYGNKQVTHLSKLMDRITNGPEDLKPFSDDKPNLSIIEEEAPPVVTPPDSNIH